MNMFTVTNTFGIIIRIIIYFTVSYFSFISVIIIIIITVIIVIIVITVAITITECGL